jgi:hypothetical protein
VTEPAIAIRLQADGVPAAGAGPELLHVDQVGERGAGGAERRLPLLPVEVVEAEIVLPRQRNLSLEGASDAPFVATIRKDAKRERICPLSSRRTSSASCRASRKLRSLCGIKGAKEVGEERARRKHERSGDDACTTQT